jgi:hypothetical protein
VFFVNRFIMTSFRKKEDCPSSDQLLMFQLGDVSLDDRESINEHLYNCEFCLAELEFYSHYPQNEESVSPSPIPAPLYDLAQAVLRRGKSSLAWIDSLFSHSSKDN